MLHTAAHLEFLPPLTGALTAWNPMEDLMTVTDRMGERHQPLVSVGREDARVVVSVRGALDATLRDRLAQVLDDLIEGQGNLLVAVELLDVETVDVDTLDVLVRAADRAWARNAQLTVSTPVAHWDGRGRPGPSDGERGLQRSG